MVEGALELVWTGVVEGEWKVCWIKAAVDLGCARDGGPAGGGEFRDGKGGG